MIANNIVPGEPRHAVFGPFAAKLPVQWEATLPLALEACVGTEEYYSPVSYRGLRLTDWGGMPNPSRFITSLGRGNPPPVPFWVASHVYANSNAVILVEDLYESRPSLLVSLGTGAEPSGQPRTRQGHPNASSPLDIDSWCKEYFGDTNSYHRLNGPCLGNLGEKAHDHNERRNIRSQTEEYCRDMEIQIKNTSLHLLSQGLSRPWLPLDLIESRIFQH